MGSCSRPPHLPLRDRAKKLTEFHGGWKALASVAPTPKEEAMVTRTSRLREMRTRTLVSVGVSESGKLTILSIRMWPAAGALRIRATRSRSESLSTYLRWPMATWRSVAMAGVARSASSYREKRYTRDGQSAANAANAKLKSSEDPNAHAAAFDQMPIRDSPSMMRRVIGSPMIMIRAVSRIHAGSTRSQLRFSPTASRSSPPTSRRQISIRSRTTPPDRLRRYIR